MAEVLLMKKRVLFVDDDRTYLNLARLKLEAGKHSRLYDFIAARSVKEAIGILDALNVDFVVTDGDIRPDGNGRDIIKYLETHMPHIPKLLCSGSAGEYVDVKQRGISVIEKEKGYGFLFNEIDRALDSSRTGENKLEGELVVA